VRKKSGVALIINLAIIELVFIIYYKESNGKDGAFIDR